MFAFLLTSMLFCIPNALIALRAVVNLGSAQELVSNQNRHTQKIMVS